MNGYRVSAVLLMIAAAMLAYRALRVDAEAPPAPPPKVAQAAVSARHAPIAPTPRAQGQHIARLVPRKEEFVVAFRLDSTLTRGMYLGDRWVSPERYHFAQPGDIYVVQAKMQRVDPRSERNDIVSTFDALDKTMIDVAPGGKPNEWTLVVMKPGTSRVIAKSGEHTRVLDVRAREVNGGMQVEINQ